MITCKLGEKEYFIDFVSGRALREMGPAMETYRRITETTEAATAGKEMPAGMPGMEEMMDTLVNWFCLVFGKQFGPDEVYDYYPADRLVHDVALALLAVQNGVTQILSEFPTKPVATGETKA